MQRATGHIAPDVGLSAVELDSHCPTIRLSGEKLGNFRLR